jgi:hypothetical protein
MQVVVAGYLFTWPSEDALADVGDPHYVSSQEASSLSGFHFGGGGDGDKKGIF